MHLEAFMTYDSNGNMIRSVTYEGGELWNAFTYVYDEENRLREQIADKEMGDFWRDGSIYYRQYDSEGNAVVQEYINRAGYARRVKSSPSMNTRKQCCHIIISAFSTKGTVVVRKL